VAELAAEFESANQEIHRMLVAKRRKRAVINRRMRTARVAGSGLTGGQRQGADRTGRGIARQVSGAAGAQVASVYACRAAQQTRGRQ
jgi:hypothetical protein